MSDGTEIHHFSGGPFFGRRHRRRRCLQLCVRRYQRRRRRVAVDLGELISASQQSVVDDVVRILAAVGTCGCRSTCGDCVSRRADDVPRGAAGPHVFARGEGGLRGQQFLTARHESDAHVRVPLLLRLVAARLTLGIPQQRGGLESYALLFQFSL